MSDTSKDCCQTDVVAVTKQTLKANAIHMYVSPFIRQMGVKERRSFIQEFSITHVNISIFTTLGLTQACLFQNEV